MPTTSDDFDVKLEWGFADHATTKMWRLREILEEALVRSVRIMLVGDDKIVGGVDRATLVNGDATNGGFFRSLVNKLVNTYDVSGIGPQPFALITAGDKSRFGVAETVNGSSKWQTPGFEYGNAAVSASSLYQLVDESFGGVRFASTNTGVMAQRYQLSLVHNSGTDPFHAKMNSAWYDDLTSWHILVTNGSTGSNVIQPYLYLASVGTGEPSGGQLTTQSNISMNNVSFAAGELRHHSYNTSANRQAIGFVGAGGNATFAGGGLAYYWANGSRPGVNIGRIAGGADTYIYDLITDNTRDAWEKVFTNADVDILFVKCNYYMTNEVDSGSAYEFFRDFIDNFKEISPDTFVVFISDHDTHLYDQGWRDSQAAYDKAIYDSVVDEDNMAFISLLTLSALFDELVVPSSSAVLDQNYLTGFVRETALGVTYWESILDTAFARNDDWYDVQLNTIIPGLHVGGSLEGNIACENIATRQAVNISKFDVTLPPDQSVAGQADEEALATKLITFKGAINPYYTIGTMRYAAPGIYGTNQGYNYDIPPINADEDLTLNEDQALGAFDHYYDNYWKDSADWIVIGNEVLGGPGEVPYHIGGSVPGYGVIPDGLIQTRYREFVNLLAERWLETAPADQGFCWPPPSGWDGFWHVFRRRFSDGQKKTFYNQLIQDAKDFADAHPDRKIGIDVHLIGKTEYAWNLNADYLRDLLQDSRLHVIVTEISGPHPSVVEDETWDSYWRYTWDKLRRFNWRNYDGDTAQIEIATWNSFMDGSSDTFYLKSVFIRNEQGEFVPNYPWFDYHLERVREYRELAGIENSVGVIPGTRGISTLKDLVYATDKEINNFQALPGIDYSYRIVGYGLQRNKVVVKLQANNVFEITLNATAPKKPLFGNNYCILYPTTNKAVLLTDIGNGTLEEWGKLKTLDSLVSW